MTTGYTLFLAASLVGGRWFGGCGSTQVVYSTPCWQPVVTCQPVCRPNPCCTPCETATPVANTEEEADPVANVAIEQDPALAAVDRPESLSEEIALGEFALPVADTEVVAGGGYDGGYAMGFVPSYGGGGYSGGGFGFGNGMGRPGAGSGVGGGSGSGGGSGLGRTNNNVDVPSNGDQGQFQGLIVNINNSQSQTQNQNQSQSQGQCGSCSPGGGCSQVPLPATAWMGILGVASLWAAKRKGLIGPSEDSANLHA